jgi:hypothetical protein
MLKFFLDHSLSLPRRCEGFDPTGGDDGNKRGIPLLVWHMPRPSYLLNIATMTITLAVIAMKNMFDLHEGPPE